MDSIGKDWVVLILVVALLSLAIPLNSAAYQYEQAFTGYNLIRASQYYN